MKIDDLNWTVYAEGFDSRDYRDVRARLEKMLYLL